MGSLLRQSRLSVHLGGSGVKRPIMSVIAHQVAVFARPTHGIDVISLDIRAVSLPESNRAFFDRMTAERAKIGKGEPRINRS